MFDLIFDSLADLVAWFYSIWPSYGMSVVFLTLTVMVFVTPLTLKSTKSMLQMQRLQPELKAIQNRHKDDRQKMNEELMAFYQENGINPLGGCLPMLIQMPVFLVLFRVVQGLTRRVSSVGEQAGWTSGRFGSKGVLDTDAILSTERVFDPDNVSVTSDLYQRLSGSTEMVSWGIDLSRSAQSVMRDSVFSALPYFILIGFVLVTSVYQQRQIQGRNTGAQINPQQQMIMKFMPYMLPVFSFTMPAALVVYFVISNVYRIGQQGYITHSLYSGDDSIGAQIAKQRKNSDGNSKSDSKGGGASGGNQKNKKGGASTGAKKDLGAKRLRSDSSSKSSSGGSKSKGSQSKKSTRSAKKSKPQSSRRNPRQGGSTGRAPTRRPGGRTTKPGSPQHKKRKK